MWALGDAPWGPGCRDGVRLLLAACPGYVLELPLGVSWALGTGSGRQVRESVIQVLASPLAIGACSIPIPAETCCLCCRCWEGRDNPLGLLQRAQAAGRQWCSGSCEMPG